MHRLKTFWSAKGAKLTGRRAPGTRDIPGIFYVEEHPGHVYIDWSFEAANEQRTFTISYTVENAVLVHQDVAELYYQFIGGEWDEPTDHARVVLTLPEGATDEELRVWGHGPLQGFVSKEGTNRVVWEVKDLPRRTFLEGRVVFPVKLVPEAANFSGREGFPGFSPRKKSGPPAPTGAACWPGSMFSAVLQSCCWR